MGKGDRKTRRGKLFSGTYGVRRRRKKDKPAIHKKFTPPVSDKKKTQKAAEEESNLEKIQEQLKNAASGK